MTEITDFGLIVLAVSATVFVALLGMRLADRFSLPYAALFLVGAALLAETFSSLQDVVSLVVERLTVVALVIMTEPRIGLGRFALRRPPDPHAGAGTFVTAGLVAVVGHYVLGFDWIFAGLSRCRDRADDPAVTFSVFGSREMRAIGHDPAGEAGMNDPVGIALMIGMIELASEEDGHLSIVASSCRSRDDDRARRGAAAPHSSPCSAGCRLTGASATIRFASSPARESSTGSRRSRGAPVFSPSFRRRG